MPKRKKKPNNNQITQRPNNKNNHIAKVQAVSFQGPLPPPQILQQYDEIVPGAAERIICQFENQVKHRQELENKVITSDVRQSYIGSVLGFIIAISAIGAGTVLAYIGQPTEGLAALLTPLAGLIGVYVWGSYQRRKERDLKANSKQQQ